MDTTEKEQLAQEQMDELKKALKKSNTVSNTGAVSGTQGYADTITLSGGSSVYNNTVIGGGYTVSPINTSSLGAHYPNVTASSYTYTTAAGAGTWGATNLAAPITTDGSGKLNLSGDNADIVINGVSLMDILKDRLNIMIPNPALEKEWEELKALGDQYRALEADIKEKAEIWKKLKG